MATASAAGRPLASTLPSHQKEPSEHGKLIPFPYSNRMSAGVRCWNQHANISHHCRRASKTQVIMDEHSDWDWSEKRTGVGTSPGPPDPDFHHMGTLLSDRRHAEAQAPG
ncbi:hypothetical protein CHARACLAT_017522 [Characodon lateralis]|uniref:Uncharacterized protein n=1 Tax=Characodon lateralis TaxID=208331 RepID=A0ABU7EAH6_9TELE|nr:hypothetical protein [Characodon lateralis]